MANPPISGLNELLNLQFDQSSKKRQKEYGLKIAKAVFGAEPGAAFILERNKQWQENAEFGQGKLNLTEFKELMDVDDNKALYRTMREVEKVAPRYKKGLLQSFLDREERPSVDAVDTLSKQIKDKEKLHSKFQLQNKDQLAQMQAASGINHQSGFVPEDEDELEIYYKVEYRLPEEANFEKFIWEILQNSNYEDLKRQLISDLIDTNICATKITKLEGKGRTPANSLSVRRCKPSRLIYNTFESPVGRDISFIGEAYPISIADARRRFKGIDENTWYDIAKKSSANLALRDTLGGWNDTWTSAYTRPYDEYKFIIFDFEVKVLDKDFYVVSPNSFGKDRLSKKKGRSLIAPENGEALEDVRLNMYCGVWVKDSDTMLAWDVAPNQIRPYQNGVDCFSTYSVVCPDNDGTLIPSFIERGMAQVKNMVWCTLKIQQMMATMKPDLIAIDINGQDGLDIGLGAMKPYEITKIAEQSGKIYWDSTDSSGVTANGEKRIPYANVPGGQNIAQINALIQLHNHFLQQLNNEWGTNPDALGQPVAARRSNKVNENQIQQAQLTTEYLYDFFVEVINQTSSKLAMLLWDTIIFNADDYKEMDGMDMQQLLKAEFDVNIDMIPTNDGKQRLEQKINIALEKGLISLGQSIRLENMDNIKDAELYLIKLEKKAQEDAARAKQLDMDNNIKGQQQSNQQAADNDVILVQKKAEAENLVNTGKLQMEGYNSIINLVTQLNVESMKLGKPIPANLQPLVDYIIKTELAKGNPQPQDPSQQQPTDQQQEAPAQDQAEPQQEPAQQEQAEPQMQ